MKRRILRTHWDLILAWVLISISIIHYFIAPDSLRMVLATILLAVLVPGYLIIQSVTWLRSLGTMERWVLTLGVSGSLSLVVYAIELILWGRPTVASLGFGIAIMSLVLTVVLLIQRMRDPSIARSSSIPALTDLSSRVSIMRRRDRNIWLAIVAVLVVVVLLAAGMALQVDREEFSEFYLLNQNGTVIGIPHNLTVGQPLDLIVGIANHEQRMVTYYVEIWMVNYTNIDMAVTVYEMYYIFEFNATMISVDVDLNKPWTSQYEIPIHLNLTRVGNYSLFFFLFLDEQEALPEPPPLDPDTNYAQTSASWRVVESVTNSIQYLRLEVSISPDESMGME